MFSIQYALYHGVATFTEVTFLDVQHAQMSSFGIEVCAENTDNVELGAAPLIQHYSVFSAWPGLGYGTLIQCSAVQRTVIFKVIFQKYKFKFKYL